MKQIAMGIDLGTSNSCVAIVEDGVLPDGHDPFALHPMTREAEAASLEDPFPEGVQCGG